MINNIRMTFFLIIITLKLRLVSIFEVADIKKTNSQPPLAGDWILLRSRKFDQWSAA